MREDDASQTEPAIVETAGVSRRKFLKRLGGAVGAVAVSGGIVAGAEPGGTTAQAVTQPTPKPTPPYLYPDPPKGTAVVWTPIDPPNTPMGTARGIFPGRVTWTRNMKATPWHGDCDNGHWWDEGTGIVQGELDKMVSAGLKSLTGAKTDADAWDKIFRHHNQQRLGEDHGYREGESVALKPNLNNAYAGYPDQDNQIDASPQSIIAMLKQLVNEAKVPQEKILVYEAVRFIPEHVYAPCHAAFPGVRWMDSKGGEGIEKVVWHPDAFCYSHEKSNCGTSIPEQVFQSTYIINMALLKGHPSCSMTMTAKNHYGTIGAPQGQSARDHNEWINTWKVGMGKYHPFVDLIGTRELGGKTILFVIDALYGTNDANDLVTKKAAGWNNLFNGEWSASWFMSLDPVAIDSVGSDFLHSEWGDRLCSSRWLGHNLNADNYLHEAAKADATVSGTIYQPDGKPLASLGAHEHWNNAKEKKYSRNLGKEGLGIELVEVLIA